MVDRLFGLFLAHKNKTCFTIHQNGTIDEKKINILKVNLGPKTFDKILKKKKHFGLRGQKPVSDNFSLQWKTFRGGVNNPSTFTDCVECLGPEDPVYTMVLVRFSGQRSEPFSHRDTSKTFRFFSVRWHTPAFYLLKPNHLGSYRSGLCISCINTAAGSRSMVLLLFIPKIFLCSEFSAENFSNSWLFRGQRLYFWVPSLQLAQSA